LVYELYECEDDGAYLATRRQTLRPSTQSASTTPAPVVLVMLLLGAGVFFRHAAELLLGMSGRFGRGTTRRGAERARVSWNRESVGKKRVVDRRFTLEPGRRDLREHREAEIFVLIARCRSRCATRDQQREHHFQKIRPA